MKKTILIILIFSLLIISGCSQEQSIQENNPITGDVVEDIQEDKIEETQNQQPSEIQTNIFKVIGVTDGDTFTIDTGEKVRLIGIDTPETNEPYYLEAKEYLRDLIYNKEVRLEKDVSETDRYDRLLRYVYIEDLFVNLALVEQGLAEAVRYEPDTKFANVFEDAEETAKIGELGIWSETTPVPTQQTQSQYICSYNAYNCDDFSTRAGAQNVFEICGGVNNDIHGLDRDNDGLACESL